jgi:MFS family permease
MFRDLLRLPIGVLVLSLCMGLGTSAATVAVAVTSLAGEQLAPDRSLATVPYGLQFVALMGSAVPLTMLMARVGRKPVNILASLFGVGAGLVSALSVATESFVLLCAGHMMLGIFLAGLASLRFAAIDRSPADLREMAISLALFGGVLAGFLGPTLARSAGVVFPFEGFIAPYLMLGFVCGIVAVILIFLPFPNDAETVREAQAAKAKARAEGRRVKTEVLSNPLYWFAVFGGAVGYGVMTLLMVASSLEMRAAGYAFEINTYMIQAHVLAMFAPSLFSGPLVRILRRDRFIAIGMAFMVGAAVVAMLAPALWAFLIALTLLGFGWNFLYVGGAIMVASLASSGDKLRAQGVNDMIVSSFSAVAALTSGACLVLFGWVGLQVFALIVLVPLIIFGVIVRFGGIPTPAPAPSAAAG